VVGLKLLDAYEELNAPMVKEEEPPEVAAK
jgi:hypothetical protein